MLSKEQVQIYNALGLKEKAFISFVGAGGKSTLFNRLAEELLLKNKRIILTTTTKMFAWQLAPFMKKGRLVESRGEETIRKFIKKYFSVKSKTGRLAVIREKIEDNGEEKVSGPSPDWLDKWWKERLADYFLVEADGAAGRPVKAPASHEPVIPLSTTDLIFNAIFSLSDIFASLCFCKEYTCSFSETFFLRFSISSIKPSNVGFPFGSVSKVPPAFLTKSL